jgi:hypothetical protein
MFSDLMSENQSSSKLASFILSNSQAAMVLYYRVCYPDLNLVDHTARDGTQRYSFNAEPLRRSRTKLMSQKEEGNQFSGTHCSVFRQEHIITDNQFKTPLFKETSTGNG